jgi:hypothetical protein
MPPAMVVRMPCKTAILLTNQPSQAMQPEAEIQFWIPTELTCRIWFDRSAEKRL